MRNDSKKKTGFLYDEIIGFKELRDNISLVMENVMGDYQVVLSENAKKNRSGSVSIISSEILNYILSVYKFESLLSYDQKTGQYEVIIDKIGIYGSGATKDEAIDNAAEMALDIADDYFRNSGLYVRLPGEREKYPYFLRIKNCRDMEEVKKILELV
ncbi:MAG: hypothetical protein PHG48_02950 [Eubacteriales bacterium]|nr:hypothetical protein [Eubacteriales bacterium]